MLHVVVLIYDQVLNDPRH